jgi:predicted alpha/beta superfamily hydrolase
MGGATMDDWRDYGEADGDAANIAGTLKVRDGVQSPQLGNARRLLVYLPPTYDEGSRRYPVLYMHDGQNLFDPATSFAGAWDVDETMEAAHAEGLDAIVVGIPNQGDERLNEYSPFVDPRLGGGKGERYVAFLCDTVKPLIDADFRTLPGREHTGVVGSSMGGLISLYAFFRRPEVFGLVGAMSPSLWFARRAIFDYIQRAPFVPGRIYLDAGTREGRGELSDVRRLCRLLRARGYREGADLLCAIEKGAGHDESAWGHRLPRELRFLLRADGEALAAGD